MARPGTETVDKARAAFIELVRQRERPTAAKIRTMIGGGGTDLIQRVIREMEDELYAKMFDLANRPDVPGTVVDTIVRLWESANDMADQRFASAKVEYEGRIEAAESAKATALARGEELETRIGVLEEQLATRTGEASALRTALETAEGRITDLEGSVAAKTEEMDRVRHDAETRIRAAEDRTVEQERLAEERYRGLESRLLENFDRERTQLGREINGLKKEVETLTAQRNTLDKEKKEATATILGLKDAQAALTAQLAEAKGTLAAVSKERDAAKRELSETRKKLSTTEKQLESWKRRTRQATGAK